MKNKFTVAQFADMFEDSVIFYVRTLDSFVYAEKMTKADFINDFADYDVIDWDLANFDHWVSVELAYNEYKGERCK